MNIDNIIKSGKIDTPALKHMLETIPYRSKNTSKRKILSLDNGLIIYMDNSHIYRVDTPTQQFYFRNEKLRRIINLATQTTTTYSDDGITKESFLRADGYHIFLQPDGKTPQHIQTPEKYRIQYQDDGQTIAYISLANDTPFVINEKLSMIQLKETIQLIKKIIPTELPSFSVKITRDGYKNELSSFDESSLPTPPTNHQIIHDPKILSDEYIPEVIKKIGIHIKRCTEVVYPQYDAKQHKCIFRDQQHQLFKPEIEDALAFVKGTTITVNTCCYILPKEDAEFCLSLQQLLTDKDITPERRKQILKNYPISKQHIYLSIFEKNQIFNTLMHEIKHIYNHILLEHRPYASDYANPTATEEYKLATENERTATFAPVMHWLNQYYKQEDPDNYDIFASQYNWVIPILKRANLKNQSHQETLSEVLNACLEDWNAVFSEAYFDEFKKICQKKCTQCLLIPEDKNQQEFLKQRRLMYTFLVYDPITKTEKYMDLSPLIKTDIPISEKVKDKIINPCKTERAKQKKALIKRLGSKETVIAAANLAHTLRRQKVQKHLQACADSPIPQIMENTQRAVPICKNIYNAWISCWSKIAHLLTIKKPQVAHIFPQLSTKNQKR